VVVALAIWLNPRSPSCLFSYTALIFIFICIFHDKGYAVAVEG
jgi:hypothetical protein